MKARVTVNLILALLIISLSALLWLTDNDSTAAVEKLIPQLTVEQIKQIKIETDRQIATQLNKDSSEWLMTSPLPARTNAFQIKSIIELIDAPILSKFTVSNKELGNFGLDTPVVTVTLNDISIEFGAINPINQQRYVKLADQIHLIQDNILPLVKGSPASLISSQLLPANANIIKIILPTSTLNLDNGKWQTEQQDSSVLSQDQFNRFIDEWRYAQALYTSLTTFDVNTKLNKTNLVICKLADGREFTFTINKLANDLILTNIDKDQSRQIEYHMHVEAYEQLLHFPNNND